MFETLSSTHTRKKLRKSTMSEHTGDANAKSPNHSDSGVPGVNPVPGNAEASPSHELVLLDRSQDSLADRTQSDERTRENHSVGAR